MTRSRLSSEIDSHHPRPGEPRYNHRGYPRLIGRTISHYEVIEKVGEGGMGVVYKARDIHLDRTVALKFLSPHLTANADARRRFLREAKAAAGLKHPNICTVYEIHDSDTEAFLALEFVDGEGLDEMIDRAPLKFEDAIEIARQVARGLDHAHSQGVVHRDIKPANIIVSDHGDGQLHATITDFGLARLAKASKLTRENTTLGTVSYMSPEQAQGMEIDQRTDIWALGVVIYEMITGKLPFRGEYDEAVLYSILNDEPEPLTAQRAGLPMSVEWVIGRALAKDVKLRHQTAADLAADLESLRARSQELSPSMVTGVRASVQQKRPRGYLPWALFAAAAVLALAVGFFAFRSSPPDSSVHRWRFDPPPSERRVDPLPAISPDGKRIAFIGGPESTLWVRDLDREEPREIAGTAGARGPFWSPDSGTIAFATQDQLMKVSATGGAPVTLCPLEEGLSYSGGSWGENDTLAFSTNTLPQIYRVSAVGGEASPLFDRISTDKGTGNMRPHWLPGGESRLLLDVGAPTEQDVVLMNLESGESTILAQGANPFYCPTGHVLFPAGSQQGGLRAMAFSLNDLAVSGEPFRLSENAVHPSVSRNGTLIYADSGAGQMHRLVWRSRSGEILGTIGQPQENIQYPRISPDGQWVAVRGAEDGNDDIWLHSTTRPLKRRLTYHARRDTRPTWSPDGKLVAFQSIRTGNFNIYSIRADGVGKPSLLIETELTDRVYGWSGQGRIVHTTNSEGDDDIWYSALTAAGEADEPLSFLQTPSIETSPQISPDGEYLAYCSNASGRFEVFVRRFPSGEDPTQVSTEGGGQAVWSADGSELFYVRGDQLIAVEVRTQPSFEMGIKRELFRNPDLETSAASRILYDVGADGKILMASEVEGAPAATSIHVFENWARDFERR